MHWNRKSIMLLQPLCLSWTDLLIGKEAPIQLYSLLIIWRLTVLTHQLHLNCSSEKLELWKTLEICKVIIKCTNARNGKSFFFLRCVCSSHVWTEATQTQMQKRDFKKKKNRFHRFHPTTAQWSSKTDLWSMGNQNPTRDLMSLPASKLSIWGIRGVSHTRVARQRRSDCEGRVLLWFASLAGYLCLWTIKWVSEG